MSYIFKSIRLSFQIFFPFSQHPSFDDRAHHPFFVISVPLFFSFPPFSSHFPSRFSSFHFYPFFRFSLNPFPSFRYNFFLHYIHSLVVISFQLYLSISYPFFGVSFLLPTLHYIFPTDILFTYSLSYRLIFPFPSIIYFIPALFLSFLSSHIRSKYSFISFFSHLSSFFFHNRFLLLYFSLHISSFLSFVFLALFPFFLSVVLPQFLFLNPFAKRLGTVQCH
ncbi:unnamed protein product [Acanthosepion pharaonis]|uniref:Uncharacterized protein n=1 Tax=Acanthosepion pharaonis TaxID=158019 RepID=A0A812C1S2_ACAPH|nr:unnamed protein product [Sepia pharaonis]